MTAHSDDNDNQYHIPLYKNLHHEVAVRKLAIWLAQSH
ncbi:hypothetical protein Y11_37911 [Yersinia enterocolitica subsp. palearctica Y11]|uniref:Uncharacterized protein n=2 Tax=Yersinia enterocolitica TaxID=630 RepID=A0A0H3NUR5_YERE1|nr:unknown protein [Yersinia enterocolitica W22703]CBY28739.1 hypothetical protein Y11_37911 [Yersinia enterocolitica subsp. palearctica Y11]CCO70418.1 hypothetical protein D322_3566 [Yersinia enterocolitica IP 10393]